MLSADKRFQLHVADLPSSWLSYQRNGDPRELFLLLCCLPLSWLCPPRTWATYSEPSWPPKPYPCHNPHVITHSWGHAEEHRWGARIACHTYHSIARRYVCLLVLIWLAPRKPNRHEPTLKPISMFFPKIEWRISAGCRYSHDADGQNQRLWPSNLGGDDDTYQANTIIIML